MGGGPLILGSLYNGTPPSACFLVDVSLLCFAVVRLSPRSPPRPPHLENYQSNLLTNERVHFGFFFFETFRRSQTQRAFGVRHHRR